MHLVVKLRDPSFRFSLFLWLVALHSFSTGIGLIFFPASWFEKVGYSLISERFFAVQGGVFHIVMSVGYLMAAKGKDRFPGVVYLSVTAKLMATVFLLTYSFAVEWIPVVFLSGIFDCFMGGGIYLLYGQYKNKISSEAG